MEKKTAKSKKGSSKAEGAAAAKKKKKRRAATPTPPPPAAHAVAGSMRPSAPDIVLSGPPEAERDEGKPRRSSMRPSAPDIALAVVDAPAAAPKKGDGPVDAKPRRSSMRPPAPSGSGASRTMSEEEENDFFESPSRASLPALDDDEDEDVHPAARTMSPHAIARRAQYRKYVKAAMAICGGVIVLGLLRAATHRAGGDEPLASAEVHRPAASASPAVPEPPAQPVPEAPPVASSAPAESAAPPAQEQPPELAAPPPAPSAAAEEKLAPSARSLVEEKRDARRALEHARWQESIAAGERATALDPNDGEAWLLLGAAYQSAGKLADARRAFTTCVRDGKKGPIGECRAMLR